MTEIMVGACSELADGDHRIVAIGELEVGIFRLGDRFVAYENRCPHHGGPVCQGKLFNRVEEIIMPDQTSRGLRFSKDRHVVCPWHGYEFDLDTGAIRATRAFASGRSPCAWRMMGSTSTHRADDRACRHTGGPARINEGRSPGNEASRASWRCRSCLRVPTRTAPTCPAHYRGRRRTDLQPVDVGREKYGSWCRPPLEAVEQTGGERDLVQEPARLSLLSSVSIAGYQGEIVSRRGGRVGEDDIGPEPVPWFLAVELRGNEGQIALAGCLDQRRQVAQHDQIRVQHQNGSPVCRHHVRQQPEAGAGKIGATRLGIPARRVRTLDRQRDARAAQ